MTMNKDELVRFMAEKAEISNKDANAALEALVKAIHQTIGAKGSIRIPDLGTFGVSERKARTGVNPQTREKMEIPASTAPSFKAGKALKETAKNAK
jgi:DNA-binding protein HU-beta